MNTALVSEGELVAPLLRHLVNVSLAGVGFLFTMLQADYVDVAAQVPWFWISFGAFVGCVVVSLLGNFAVISHVLDEVPRLKWLRGCLHRRLLYVSWGLFGVGILSFVGVVIVSI